MHTNENTIAINFTERCNLRCPVCYFKKNPRVIPYKYVQKAMELFHPEYIVAFGGEAILVPDLLKRFHRDYPDVGIILHTNGTIFNTAIFDICYSIYLTIESFFYKYNKQHRNMSYAQYKVFLKTIQYCKDKIECIHNIYPTENDPAFFPMARLAGIRYNVYPMISAARDCDGSSLAVKQYLKPIPCVLTNPKIRILVDGTVTRDMTGHYNICHIDEYHEGMDRLVPIAEKCKACKKYKRCFSANMFPHFCKIVLDTIDYSPAFCHYV